MGPPTNRKRIAITVKSSAERAIRRGHPWVFDGSIRTQSHGGASGDLAVIFDRNRRFLAIGLYDPDSPIRIRILHQGTPNTIGPDFFLETILAAASRRQSIDSERTTAFRMLYGEGDGLPGLVIDKYGTTLVMKIYTAAWIPWLNQLVAATVSAVDTERIVLRISRAIGKRLPSGLDDLDGTTLHGPNLPGTVRFLENNLLFEADVFHGNKTGFFLDQRDNRSIAERLAKGRRVLNMFAYTGAFSLYVARGGAVEVTSVDVSGPALRAAQKNFALNQENAAIASVQHTTIQGDAFESFERFVDARRSFDMVIVDPPSFAAREAQVPAALNAYRRLIGLALQVLDPLGVLVMASCSSRIGADAFFELCHQKAVRSGRVLREIERTQHPLDHPITLKESAYLKCLFATCP